MVEPEILFSCEKEVENKGNILFSIPVSLRESQSSLFHINKSNTLLKKVTYDHRWYMERRALRYQIESNKLKCEYPIIKPGQSLVEIS